MGKRDDTRPVASWRDPRPHRLTSDGEARPGAGIPSARDQLALFTPTEAVGVQLSLFPDLVPPAHIYPERTPAEWIDECRARLAAARDPGQMALEVGA